MRLRHVGAIDHNGPAADREPQQTSSRSRQSLESGLSATHPSNNPRTKEAGAAMPHSRSGTHNCPSVRCPNGPGGPGSL